MYILYTDGSSSFRNCDSGWAFILLFNDEFKHSISGYQKPGTNNTAELMAVIEGLKRVPIDELVMVYTDSKYVTNTFNMCWLETWKSNNWISERTGNEIKNKELWLQLDHLNSTRFVTYRWLPGHSNHFYNDLCDERAKNSRHKKEKITYNDIKSNIKRKK